MFKGFIALFSTGIIFHPLTMLGVAIAFYAGSQVEKINELFGTFKDNRIYIIALVSSLLFNWFLKKPFNKRGKFDFTSFMFNVVFGTIRVVFSFAIAVCFILFLAE